MIALAFFSALARLGLTAMIAVMLTELGHILNLRERLGAGIMGGSGFLTVAVILDVNKDGTPYDTWAGLLFTGGCLLFFWGFMARKLVHEKRNRDAVTAARRHIEARNK